MPRAGTAGQRRGSQYPQEPRVTAPAGDATRLARAKLNVRLEVGRRAGSLHSVVSVVAPLSLADELRFYPDSSAFWLHCSDASIAQRDNLVWRAAHAFPGFEPAIRIELDKRIPSQAGLGGGSADAAVTLEYVAGLLAAAGKPAAPNFLPAAAFALGSDVPAALVPGLKIVAGCGDLVTGWSCRMPQWGIVLLRPAHGSETARAYELLDAAGERPQLGEPAFERARVACEAMAAGDFHAFVQCLHNDFSLAIEERMPKVGAARQRLTAAGAAATLLCGSGSCVAGFFQTNAAAQAAASRLAVAADEWSTVTAFHD